MDASGITGASTSVSMMIRGKSGELSIGYFYLVKILKS
jgi:hypothetical protein